MTVTRNSILIVDDEEVIRDICLRSLKKSGYEIMLAENGVKALECLRQNDVEVVFSDYRMPMMDGIELLETIKRDHPHVEVIIMTAFATIERAIHAMKQGAYDFILKPVKPDRIRLAAERCFEKVNLSKENAELRNANKQLTELETLKSRFIAITSHELRTPVSHLKGFVGILNDAYFDELSDEERSQCLSVMSDAITDLENIVVNMHNLTHISDSELNLNCEKRNIEEIVKQSVASYQLISKQRSQKLQYVGNSPDLLVEVDPKQISTVFNELIQNAIKYTHDGGEIFVDVSAEEQYSVVSVKDTGIGIDVSEHGKIFEKFYEVQNSNYHSTSKVAFMGGGLGLGLSSVRTIVEAHGGGVKVKSKKGEGVEFLIYLPLAADDGQ